MTTDEKALATLRQPGWDPNGLHDQYVTEDAVTAFLAPYRDSHPDGRPLHEHHVPRPWTGPRNAAGDQTYLPSLWAILDHVADVRDLTDSQVVHLVMTSTDNESYRPEEWQAMVDGKIAEAKVRHDTKRKKERNNHDDERAERSGRVQRALDHIAGTHSVPDSALSHRAKLRRTKAIKAAAERRERRRKVVEGIVVEHRNSDWREMTAGQVKDHQSVLDKLAAKGTLDAVFAEELSGKIPPDLYYLQRFGRVKRL
ncbi:hypothetical protein [Mesorhizobium sp.]|uniref:hypothetical protein n=1 Tax=Mesorhizobium sp. TaxID=1871066 RepID=UPI001221BC3D|nr:hypothetical protein [Mesorhizobium sp.]TIL43660.1 MAG: hypothetical protein E5Y86_20855 [Mesorhizobium sp.]